MKCPLNEISYIWNVQLMKYPINEMSNLWNVLSMKCPVYEMSYLYEKVCQFSTLSSSEIKSSISGSETPFLDAVTYANAWETSIQPC